MAYAGRRWISDFTYNGVYQNLKLTAGLAEAESMAQEDRILASGVITPDLSTARLEYVYLSDNHHFVNDAVTGTYTLELQDAGGQVLVSDTFGVWFTDGGAGGEAQATVLPFLRVLPADPLAARLVLKEEGDVLATRLASATPPTVTWTAPNSGEALSGTVELVWTGYDDDGDPLTYIVQYSADGGATWEPVALHLTATQTTVDMAEFPGGDQCLFRVLASDGFYTAVDQANGFSTAPRQDPTAFILAPETGQTYDPGQPLTFQGLAYDQDLNDLSGASLAWVSDRDGALGTGSLLEVILSPGWHTVALTATDGYGLSVTDQVTFYVGYRVHLPLIVRQSSQTEANQAIGREARAGGFTRRPSVCSSCPLRGLAHHQEQEHPLEAEAAHAAHPIRLLPLAQDKQREVARAIGGHSVQALDAVHLGRSHQVRAVRRPLA
jgi:hypothetical protein